MTREELEKMTDEELEDINRTRTYVIRLKVLYAGLGGSMLGSMKTLREELIDYYTPFTELELEMLEP